MSDRASAAARHPGGVPALSVGDRVMALAGSALSGVVFLFALASLGLFLASALGLIPWLSVALRFGEITLPGAGPWIEGGLAALGLVLFLYLPAHARVARLERSHRDFHIGMEDVARAYAAAHAADRQGAFALAPEFDAMRARLEHLRKHPDLGHLEPELLELAAQMSYQARDLARIYSDDKVARARSFLESRQREAQTLAEQIAVARRTCDELKRWLTDVETEERQLSDLFKLLERDLRAVLPPLGYELEEPVPANVVSLPKPVK
ncbi:MAG: DNA repair protein [Sphingomonadales bacterium]|nr:DNA repair protein [Sphingomonadales bacterium]